MKMKKIYYRLCFASALIFLATLTALAQKSVVTGKVADGTGSPMPGVNIIVKGTTLGTTTDVNGDFAIEASESDILLVSFIGFVSKELPVGAQTKIDVAMVEDISTLQEIVVVGYGVQKKVLNTGANLQVKGEDLERLSTTNALQALQGQTPGVQITSTSGQPGEPLKVIIRGAGTPDNSSPLYVVDGVLTGDITYLNNSDIQSIDVLKDAASAAIYGSQASNGVVLITTKKGKAGRAQVTFDAYYGVQNVAKKVDMLNAQEYATILNEAAVNSGKLPYYTNDSIAAMGSGTNWVDKMFVKNAPTSNYSLGVSGGTETSVYSASLSYTGQAGILGGKDLSNYERYNFRINSEHKLYKNRVTVGQNLTFAYMNNNGVGVGGQYDNTLRGALNTTPLLIDSPTDSVGLFGGQASNPYRQMLYSYQNDRNEQKVLGNLYAQVELIKNLKFRTSLGIDFYANEKHSYTPVYALSIYNFSRFNKATMEMGKGKTILWDNLLSYNFSLAADHHFDLMVGTSAYQYTGTKMNATNANLVFDDLEHAYLDAATNKDGALMSLGGGPEDPNKRMSYFGRVNYDFRETFLLNASFRADGSSQFAKGNRWGYFPAISAGWVITNGELLSATSNWLNFAKLRVSWGQTGNQNVKGFQYSSPVKTTTTNYIFGPTEGSNGLIPGAYLDRLSNPNLQWETAEQTNIGVDARFFNGKVSANIDWYTKSSKNWLVEVPVLATAGANPPYVNGGNVTNKGLELALTYNNSVGEFNYTIGINGAYNQNKVNSIPNEDGILHPLYGTNQLYNNAPEFYRAQNGFPIGYFWGLKTNGIFQTEEEIASYTSAEGKIIQPGAKPGDVRYIDKDGNGAIEDKDKTMIGNPNPKYTFGFTLSADYKGFDFSLLASGVSGNQLIQSYRNQANPYSNYTTDILNRWHGVGSSNTMPRVTETNNNWTNVSDLYIHDGDYLRINNLTIGYNLSRLLSKRFFSQFRLYASVLNLYTFTKYNGMDPEVGFGPPPDRDKYSKFSMSSGVDLGYYPRPRTYMVGVNVKF